MPNRGFESGQALFELADFEEVGLIHQLTVIRRAIDELMEYLRRKMRELRQTVGLLRQSTLNHRQVALITHALRHSDAEYTVRSHSTSHRVTSQSARTDLLDLERLGLLERRQVGKRFVFSPVADLDHKVPNAKDRQRIQSAPA